MGAAIFDLQIAALCIEQGVDIVWTGDERFPADPRLSVEDPLATREP